jgi:hypothetical protein
MITPKEAVDFERNQKHEKVKEFLFTASARDLQEFFHLISAYTTNHTFNRARVALDVRLAEDAERTAQKLVTGTDSLIKQTETLVKLTRGLYFLTIVLICFGAFDVIKFLLGLICHHSE